MKYAIAKRVLWKGVDDEVVIVDPEKDDYSYLNATGKKVWEMIEKDCSVDTITAELARQYDGSPATIKSEVELLISDLVQAGLIQKI